MNDACPTSRLRGCALPVSLSHWPVLFPLRTSALAPLPGQIRHNTFCIYTWLAQSEVPGPTFYSQGACLPCISSIKPQSPSSHKAFPVFCITNLIVLLGTSLGRGNSSVCSGGNWSCSRWMVWLQLWISADGYPVVPALLIECRHENQGSAGTERACGNSRCTRFQLLHAHSGYEGSGATWLRQAVFVLFLLIFWASICEFLWGKCWLT